MAARKRVKRASQTGATTNQVSAEGPQPPLTLGAVARVAALAACALVLADGLLGSQLAVVVRRGSVSTLTTVAGHLSAFSWLRVLVLFGSSLVSLVWIYQVVAWMQARSSEGASLTMSAGMAAGGLLIPFYNLYHALVMAKQLEAGSASEAGAESTPEAATWWYGAWVAGVVVTVSVTVLGMGEGKGPIANRMAAQIYPALLMVAHQLMWVRLMALVDARLALAAGSEVAPAKPYELWRPTTLPASAAWAAAALVAGWVTSAVVIRPISAIPAIRAMLYRDQLNAAAGDDTEVLAALRDPAGQRAALARLVQSKSKDKLSDDLTAELLRLATVKRSQYDRRQMSPADKLARSAATVLGRRAPDALAKAIQAQPANLWLIEGYLDGLPKPSYANLGARIVPASAKETLLLLAKTVQDSHKVSNRLVALDVDQAEMVELLAELDSMRIGSGKRLITVASETVADILIHRVDHAALDAEAQAKIAAMPLTQEAAKRLASKFATRDEHSDLTCSYVTTLFTDHHSRARPPKHVVTPVEGALAAAGPVTIAALVRLLEGDNPHALELLCRVAPDHQAIEPAVARMVGQEALAERTVRALVFAGDGGKKQIQRLVASGASAARTVVTRLNGMYPKALLATYLPLLFEILEAPDYYTRFADKPGAPPKIVTGAAVSVIERCGGDLARIVPQMVASDSWKLGPQHLGKDLIGLVPLFEHKQPMVVRGAARRVFGAASASRPVASEVVAALAAAMSSSRSEVRLGLAADLFKAIYPELPLAAFGREGVKMLEGFIAAGPGEYKDIAAKTLVALKRRVR